MIYSLKISCAGVQSRPGKREQISRNCEQKIVKNKPRYESFLYPFSDIKKYTWLVVKNTSHVF